MASFRGPADEQNLTTDSVPFMHSLTGPPPPQRSSSFATEDTLEHSQDDVRSRLAAHTGDSALKAPPTPALGIDPTSDPGWTPFQPPVAERDVGSIRPMPIVNVIGDDVPLNGGTVLDQHEVNNSAPGPSSQPPVSDEIPVDTDLSEIPSSDEMAATHPRLPLDSEEIRIEEGDRASETGEVEVAPEDLVSVESLPSPVQQPPPVKAPTSVKSATATSLMQAVPPPASPSRPNISVTSQTPPTGTPALSDAMGGTAHGAAPMGMPGHAGAHLGASPAHPASAPAHPAAPPASAAHLGHPNAGPPAGAIGVASSIAAIPTPPTGIAVPVQVPAPAGPATARQPSNPALFVPPVGALAPPPMTDTAVHRKKTRPWWEELFNDDFIRTMAKVTDAQIGKEVNFIEESLGCEAGAMILDLACGTGRHAVELAARGYQVVGFDLSLAMLARASDEAQDRNQKINFVQGDMREMTFEETFDGVYSWNTSFGYFDEEKNGAVIARVHKALKKGGQFLLDVVNRDYIVRQAPSLAWFEGDGCICMDEMTIDFITSRMKVKRTLMMDDGRTKEIEYSIRTYALHELGKMLHDNGFRVAEVSGRTGTPGVFFGCESPRTLILAEKR
jgi:SAM-dependent methyltransferase